MIDALAPNKSWNNSLLDLPHTALREEDGLARLTLRVRSLLMADPLGDGQQRQSLITAAYDISLALEWIEVRVRNGGFTTDVESELLVLALELSVLEREWFCGDH
jgi:hypothetical protein